MWDFSHPYRTELWYNEVKDLTLTTPIFIASMNRPNAPIFSVLPPKNKATTYLFIRNTKEQKEMYTQYSDILTIVCLPDWISDLGETREYMLQYAKTNKFKNIFLFDDRIKSVKFLYPKKSKTGNVSLVAFPKQTLLSGLLVWEKILELYPFSLSAPAHSGFSHYPQNINAPYTVNNGIIAAIININIEDISNCDIHYRRLRDCGGEDFAFLIDVMKAGLPTCKISDLEYNEIPSDKINGGTHTNNISRTTDMEKRLKILYTSYLNIPYPSSHPYVYIRKIRGIPYPYIRWKYWKEFYAQNKTKDIIV